MPRRVLEDFRVVLTGASSGIGRAIAVALARRGARLWIAARREGLLQTLAAECRRLEATVEISAGDLTRADFRDRLIADVLERWGALDGLINNAGASAHGTFEASNEQTLRQVMEVNFFAVTELTRMALPLLRVGRQPAIVNVTSILAHRGLPLNGEYCASKFALRGWSEALRVELAGEGIDVLLVSPGSTKTELFENLIAKKGDLPWSDSPTVPPETVAEQTVKALERSRREIFPNWRGRAMVIANRLAPGLVDRVVTRMMNRSGKN